MMALALPTQSNAAFLCAHLALRGNTEELWLLAVFEK